jgi:hypothetical protein
VIPDPVPFEQCPSNLSPTSIGLIIVGIVLALLLLIILIQKGRRHFKSRNPKFRPGAEEPTPQGSTTDKILRSQPDRLTTSANGRPPELEGRTRTLSEANPDAAISEVLGSPASPDATSERRISEVHPANLA